ncbi:M23 family metallopeptidase [Treponema sp. OttesenSCG-928-L16]|nr:M23 family metallopeptidase [Treponema sp. OttesenSCG-928-L16]
MASVHRYKRFENSIVQKIKKLFLAIVGGIGAFFASLYRIITRRYTVMLVPHSEKKVYNLHINILSICCVALILAGLIGAFFWYGSAFSDVRGTLTEKDNRLKEAQASLDQLRDETSHLLRAAKNFQAALATTLSTLGVDRSVSDASNASMTGDLSAFFDVRESAEGTLKEADDVRRLSEYLASAVEPVREIGDLLDSQSALLTDIPSMWPIRGGIGHISMFFGQNENPFTGQWYIHKGIDLSTYRQGDPVIATADGQVVTVDYDMGGFGNYIIIKHKHGFYTRYAHLQSFRVDRGQRVQQGQVIGYIGNTGLSTGPHLHYEVHIGSDVVDPLKYLNIRSSLAKAANR